MDELAGMRAVVTRRDERHRGRYGRGAIALNIVLPGGATATGMIPDELPEAARRILLLPEIMGPPAVFLASGEAEGLTGQRIVAKDFDSWLAAFRSEARPAA